MTSLRLSTAGIYTYVHTYRTYVLEIIQDACTVLLCAVFRMLQISFLSTRDFYALVLF